jgi:polyisoprenoid-binding protein YceI
MKPVRSLLLRATSLSALALLSMAATAQQKLDLAKSEVVFVSKQMGVPVEGRFRKFDAKIAFDPKKPEGGSVSLSIDIGSATLGAPETDAELPKAVWFNTAKFPQANFTSSAIKATGAGKFDVAGKLVVKGQTHDLVVPVSLAQNGAATTATGAFSIKRLDFKIGEGEWADTSMVANDVQVKFKLNLSGVPAL